MRMKRRTHAPAAVIVPRSYRLALDALHEGDALWIPSASRELRGEMSIDGARWRLCVRVDVLGDPERHGDATRMGRQATVTLWPPSRRRSHAAWSLALSRAPRFGDLRRRLERRGYRVRMGDVPGVGFWVNFLLRIRSNRALGREVVWLEKLWKTETGKRRSGGRTVRSATGTGSRG